MTILLVWFAPSHQRGQITMSAREADGTRAVTASHCCAAPDATPAAPSEKDKANCAVCFWAAGILPIAPVVFDVRPIDVERVKAEAALAQCARWFIPSDSLARGPPLTLA